VVPPNDPVALSDAVACFVDDPALSRQVGQQARRHAEAAFDIGAIANRFERLLQRLHEGPARRRQSGAALSAFAPPSRTS
jgi:glycosyltransferase involved in cell wall biosynthesis